MPADESTRRRPVMSTLAGLGVTLAGLASQGAPAFPAAALVPAAEIAAARDAVYPALVNITAVSRQYAGGRAMRFPSVGSGVIVSPRGHVLTNYHVAGESTRLTCTLTSGEVLDAEVVMHDPLTDLSVLILKGGGDSTGGKAFPFAGLGDSSALEVGHPVLAMGNPLALSSSVTLGIVSNPRRVFTDVTGSEISDLDLGSGQRTGIFTRWIQHDALILPGNSGGPLVSLAGEVVGINELGGNGFGFAIPSNVAAGILEQAVEKREIRRGWLGLSFLPVEKLGRETGALVAAVLPGSAAEGAGIEAGDVVVRLAGEEVTVRFLEQLPPLYRTIADLAPGDRIEIEVLRGGEKRKLEAELESMAPFLGEEAEIRELGITVRENTGPTALARRLPSSRGLIVTGVRAGYPAEQATPKISRGDLILAFNGRETGDLESLRDALSEGKADAAGRKRKNRLLRAWRDGEELLSVVRLRGRPERRGGGELPRAWLGLRTQVLTRDLAALLDLGDVRGFRVTEVYSATSAAEAGFRVGDLLIGIDGEGLRAYRLQDREDLRRNLQRRRPGDEVRFSVLRSGRSLEIAAVLEQEPENAARAPKVHQEELEFSVRDVTAMDRIEKRWQGETDGVLVAEAVPGGWAQMAGLRLGDLILSIGGEKIPDVAHFDEVVTRLVRGRSPVIEIFLRRGHRTHFVFLEPDWTKVSGAP